VVHCVGDRSQLLRDSSLYGAALEAMGVREIDFSSLVRTGAARWLWRRLFAKAPADEHSIRENLAAARAAGLRSAAGRASLLRSARAVSDRSRRMVQRASLHLVRIESLLPSLRPDLVLLGNRSTTDFPGRDGVFAHLAARDDGRRWVVLVPHAAHETIRDEFTPYDERGDPLPAHADYWLVLDDVETAARFPGLEHQFAHVGYPGLDPAWADWLRDLASVEPARADAPLRAVLIGRKFSAPGAPASSDPFTLSYEEMLEHVDRVAAAIASVHERIEVTVKPHPSSNMALLTSILRARDLQWSVSHDPVAALATSSDVFIGIFSTILVVPMAFGLPTVIVDSRVQRFVDERWPLMRDLYRGFELFSADEAGALAAAVGTACAQARDRRAGARAGTTSDQLHLDRFFPADPMARCLMRVEEMVR
jgi:hypothetical protein